jgi:pimeloyl-ACP methyl ester carboxylesterase
MPASEFSPSTEHFETVEGRRVRYLAAGGGQPLVLLHAFPLTADMWRPQLAAVPAGWRLLAPDLRGLGRSDRSVSAPARAMADHAGDVLALLDRLHIENAVIGGLSMGGYVTFALWRLAPRRFRGMVLADTRAEADTPEGRANREKMLAALAETGLSAVADTMLPKLFGPQTAREQPALLHETRRVIEENTKEGVADAIVSLMTRPDSTSLLGSVDVPVQLIVGRDDELTPVPLHDRMQAAMPNAALTIIEGAGHLSNLERPDVFNRTLAQFLQSLT